jgi:NitT/TauT family transport system substrate-binding protein
MSSSRRTWLAGISSSTLFALPHPSAAQTAPLATPVRIGTSAAETYAQPFYAQDQGLFQKAGLSNVTIELLATGAAVSSAVAGGAADIGVVSTVTMGNAVIRGVPFVAIAPSAITTPKAPVSVLCIARASSIKRPRDFEGQTIAVPSLGQAADLAIRVWLIRNGADLSKVRIVEAPFIEMGPGLERGTFAGATISDPALTGALKKNAIRPLADFFSAIAREHMVAVWFTTRQFITANPEAVRRAAVALTEAGRWANQHQYESAAIVSKVAKIDVDVVRSEKRTLYGEHMRSDDLQPQLDAAFKFGFLSRQVNASEFLPR